MRGEELYIIDVSNFIFYLYCYSMINKFIGLWREMCRIFGLFGCFFIWGTYFFKVNVIVCLLGRWIIR